MRSPRAVLQQSLAVQLEVDRVGASLARVKRAPELTEPHVVLVPAERTGAMARGKCRRLVEEEELRELSGLQQRAALPAAELEAARDPALHAVAASDASGVVVQAAAVPVDEAARGVGDEPTQRRHPVLERHPGTVSRPAPYTRRMADRDGTKLIAENRRARRDYELVERVEAGIVLTGSEVKSVRGGQVQLGQAYADIREGEAWLVGASISEYAQAGGHGHQTDRDRKLLLHRGEIDSLYGKVREKGLTLVPTRMYFKDGRVKVEIALARGRERVDKRRVVAARDAQRDIERALKRRR